MEQQGRAATTRDSEKYIVRFPEGMRDRIAELAKKNGRSMNAEIVARLQQSLASEGDATAGEMHDLLVQFDRMLDDKLRRFHVIDDGHGVRVVHTGDVAADGDDEEVGRLKEILARDDGVSPLPELKLEPTPTKGLPGRSRPR